MKNRFGAKVDRWGIVEKKDIGEHNHKFSKKFIGSVTQPDMVISQCQACGEWHKFDKKDFMLALNESKTQ